MFEHEQMQRTPAAYESCYSAVRCMPSFCYSFYILLHVSNVRFPPNSIYQTSWTAVHRVAGGKQIATFILVMGGKRLNDLLPLLERPGVVDSGGETKLWLCSVRFKQKKTTTKYRTPMRILPTGKIHILEVDLWGSSFTTCTKAVTKMNAKITFLLEYFYQLSSNRHWFKWSWWFTDWALFEI